MDTVVNPASCPRCGQSYPAGAMVCAACGYDAANAYVAPTADPAQRGSNLRRFAAIATVCMLVVIGVVVPGLVIPAAVLLTPTLVRTSAVLKHRRAAGLPVSGRDWRKAALASGGVVILTSVAACAAFVAVCFPVGLPFLNLGPNGGALREQIGMACAYLLGTVAGLFVWFLLMRRFWPKAAARKGPDA